jgi:hypothetical protein
MTEIVWKRVIFLDLHDCGQDSEDCTELIEQSLAGQVSVADGRNISI